MVRQRTLHDLLLTRFGRRADRARTVAVNLVQNTGAPTPWHAVLEIWSGEPDVPSSWDEEIDRHIARRAMYRVAELVEKDTGPRGSGQPPGRS